MTDYMTADRWGERRLDITAITRDLAPLLGATPGKDEGVDWRGSFDLDGVHFWLRPESGARKGRVEVHAYDPRQSRLHYGASFVRWPSITFDASRPLDKIAAEIARRVIAPARDAMAVITEKLAAQDADDAKLAGCVAKLQARWPFLRIDVKADVATIYGSKDGGSFTGRMRSDGQVWIDRVAIAPSRAGALLDVVFG
jgi:hypothetical protein